MRTGYSTPFPTSRFSLLNQPNFLISKPTGSAVVCYNVAGAKASQRCNFFSVLCRMYSKVVNKRTKKLYIYCITLREVQQNFSIIQQQNNTEFPKCQIFPLPQQMDLLKFKLGWHHKDVVDIGSSKQVVFDSHISLHRQAVARNVLKVLPCNILVNNNLASSNIHIYEVAKFPKCQSYINFCDVP